MQHGNVSRNLLHATHLLAPNEHTPDSLVVPYETDGLFRGKTAQLGSPRIDRMLDADPAIRAGVFARLGLVDDGRSAVFYTPTWRGTTSSKHFDARGLAADLKALATRDSHVVFRAHHLTEALIRDMKLEVNLVPAAIDTYEVLGITDVLVTDYSRIFFDFLPRRKPIIFYAYDLEEYRAERGLYFALEDMPGEIARPSASCWNASGGPLRAGSRTRASTAGPSKGSPRLNTVTLPAAASSSSSTTRTSSCLTRPTTDARCRCSGTTLHRVQSPRRSWNSLAGWIRYYTASWSSSTVRRCIRSRNGWRTSPVSRNMCSGLSGPVHMSYRSRNGGP